MGVFLSILISLVIYLGGGWCVFNIYLSIIDIESATIQSIYSSEILTYNILAGIINVIFLVLWEHNGGHVDDRKLTLAMGIPAATWLLCAYVFPISMGASILNTILNVIAMTVCCALWLNRVL